MTTATGPLIESHLPRLAELRHRLHQIPEMGFEEFKTAAVIREQLDALHIQHVDGVTGAPTATVAMLGDTSRPCIALRADIDALPIGECTGLPYASTHDGMMHACGHDGHTAILLGAAAVLKAMEADLPVCVKLLFQPAEEFGGGAGRLVDAGVLDGRVGPPVEAIFGLHGWPGLKVGVVATKPGPLLAAADGFTAVFTGKGCHGAFPHMGRDPIVAACEATINLQQFVSREVDPTDQAVITVGIFQAGTAVNIIPDTATIKGTLRTILPETRQRIIQTVRRRCEGIAAACDCTVRLEFRDGYPITVNDPIQADYVALTAKRALGNDRFYPVARAAMGAEDFAYYVQKVPGCFFLVGVEPWGRDEYPPLHSDRYDFTDSAISVGMKMFVELACGWGRP